MKTLITLILVTLTQVVYSQTWSLQLKNDSIDYKMLEIENSLTTFNYTYKNWGYCEKVFDFQNGTLITRTLDSTIYEKIDEYKIKGDCFEASVRCEGEYVCRNIILTKNGGEFILLTEEFIDTEIEATWSKIKSIDIK